MRSVHVIDLADYLKVHAHIRPSGMMEPEVSINYERLDQVLPYVQCGDPIVFVLPVDRTSYGAARIPCMQQQLQFSNVKTEYFPVANVDRDFVRTQLAHIFARRKLPLHLIEFDIKGDGARCYDLLAGTSTAMAYGLSEAKLNLKSLPAADQLRMYSSRETFADHLKHFLPAAESVVRMACMAPGQMWPAQKHQFAADLEKGRIRRVFSDVDNTFMMTDWLSYREYNACDHCDHIYQKLLDAFPACRLPYSQEIPASQRYALLKQGLFEALKHGKLDDDQFTSLYGKLNAINDIELYRARLDVWFNRLHEQVYTYNPGNARKLKQLYLDGADTARGLFEKESEFLRMLLAWLDEENPRIVRIATKALQDLHQSLSVISYRPFVSADVLRSLDRARLAGVDTRISTMRAKPRAGSVADRAPLSLSVVVQNVSRAHLIKPDAHMQRMVSSASYLNGHRHHCHVETVRGQRVGPVHPSSKILYHTMELLMSGEKFEASKQHVLYLFDDRSHETHPLLLQQCNALLKRYGYGHVRWRAVTLCQGGELVKAGLPHLDHRATADHSSLMCDHCMPERLFAHVRHAYAELAAATSGASAAFDSNLFHRAYQQAWSKVILTRSTPAISLADRCHGHLTMQHGAAASAKPQVKPAAKAVMSRSAIDDMSTQLAAVAARRAKRSQQQLEAAKTARMEVAAEAASEYKRAHESGSVILTKPVTGKIDWASFKHDDSDSEDGISAEDMLLASVQLQRDDPDEAAEAVAAVACKR